MEPEQVKQLAGDYRIVFGSAEGKRVLAHLEACFAERSSLVSGDPYGTHANEGRRAVVLHIRR